MAVSPHHLPALGIRRESPGPALVHGVSGVIVDGDRNGGVTGHALHGLAIDQPVPLELPGEIGRFDGIVDECVERDVHDHEIPRPLPPSPEAPAFADVTIPVRASQTR